MRIKCPQCGVSGSVSIAFIGNKVSCPKCKNVFQVTEEKCTSVSEKEPIKKNIEELSGCISNSDPVHPKVMAHKGISRIDQIEKRTHGWYVRVRVKGEQYAKFFSDGKFGGENSSLNAAIKWRDETEKTQSKGFLDHYNNTTETNARIALENIQNEIVAEEAGDVSEARYHQKITEEKCSPLSEKEPYEKTIEEVSRCIDNSESDQEAKTYKDISRIDQIEKRTHGWYVRVRFRGKTHSKFFSDGKFGGENSSLHAAIKWRDETEKTLGKARTDRHTVTVSGSSTGEVGVRFNSQLYRYDISWVTAGGKQGKTSVSIQKHGKEKAFEIAQKIRQERETERLSVPNYKQPVQKTKSSLPSELPLESLYLDDSTNNMQKSKALSDDTPSSITIRKKGRGKIGL